MLPGDVTKKIFFHLWIHFQVQLWIDQLEFQETNYDCVIYC